MWWCATLSFPPGMHRSMDNCPEQVETPMRDKLSFSSKFTEDYSNQMSQYCNIQVDEKKFQHRKWESDICPSNILSVQN